MAIEKVGLVAGASGRELTETLHNRGISVAIVGGRPDDAGMDIADWSLVCDLSKKQEILDFFKGLSIDHLVLGTGHVLAFELTKFLSENGMTPSVDIDASLLAKDKGRFQEALRANGIRVPEFRTYDDASKENIDDAMANIGLPCVVKSRIDRILPQRASTLEELTAAFNEVVEAGDKILCEQFIDGIDTSVPVVSDGKKVEALLVNYCSKARVLKLKGFDHTPQDQNAGEAAEKALLQVSENVVRSTGLIGLCRVDAMVDTNGDVYVFECNSVTVTGKNARHQYFTDMFIDKVDIDMPGLLVDAALTYWGD